MSKLSDEDKQFNEPKEDSDYNEKLIELMKKGNPVEYILDVFNIYHVGDRNVAKLLLLSIGCQSIINSNGIHVSIVGKSSSGKTHCCEIMSNLMPERYIRRTQLSPKAIYYIKGWEKGTVIWSNDVNLSTDMDEVIKRSIDIFKEGNDSYTVVDAKKNSIKLIIPKRLTWWLTSVKGAQDEQVLNRFCTVKIDESINKYEEVLERQKYKMGLPLKISKQVKLCQDIIQIIKDNEFKVVVPPELTDKIEWLDDITDSRRYPMFKNVIKAFAVFNHMQREIKDDKLYANKRDIDNAINLYNKIRGNILLDDDERQIWDIIYNQNTFTKKISVGQITEIFHKSKTTTRKAINRLMEKIPPNTIECESKTPMNGGREFYYSTSISPKDMENCEWVKWIA